ncbi:transglutaminase family protein [Aeromicrobium sp. Sec7.5]|uniref:transglutaminase family protein n=1 Tax=Aeromicrobium sp. Sec7.5 TaxID=3121276 RepID=UPI002FE47FB9
MTRSGLLVERLVLLGAMAVLAGGFVPVLSGTWWWVTVVGYAAIVLLVTGAFRALALRGAVAAGVVTAVIALLWGFAPASLALGFVPTPSSLTTMVDLLARARTVVAEQAPPVDATTAITLVTAGSFSLVALAGDLLLQRRRGVPLIGVLFLVLYLVPAVVVEEVPSFVVLAVPAAAWLLLLHRSERPAVADRAGSRAGSRAPFLGPASLTVGLGAVVLAFALAPVLPDTSSLTGVADDIESGPFNDGINPILSLGDDLRSPSTALALEYTTDGPPPYLSVAMLRDFTGDTWEPVERDSSGPAEGRADLAEGVEVDLQVVEVEIRDLRTTMLPVPYPAVDVRGLVGDWDANRAGLTLGSDSGDSRGQTYTVTSLDRQPTAQQLATALETYPTRLDPYLELPDDLPGSISDTAELVAGSAVGAYAKAQALQQFFRSGAFAYSETAPVDGEYDGNGMAVLDRFLEERSGYCVHFSSAMAVMARSLGVPARIMVGYAPGSLVEPGPDSQDDEERYRVTADQLHAWPQIYVDGVGWIEFEPTPGIVDGQGTSDADGGTPEPTAAAPKPQPEAATAEPAPDALEDPADVAAAQAEVQELRREVLLGLGAVLLVLALAPGTIRLALRRRRLRASATADDWWREVVATAEDLGVPAETSTTVAAHVAVLDRYVRPETRESLARLRSVLEERRYGPHQGRLLTRESTARDDAVAVVDDLLASAPRGRRRRARLLPASLARWR